MGPVLVTIPPHPAIPSQQVETTTGKSPHKATMPKPQTNQGDRIQQGQQIGYQKGRKSSKGMTEGEIVGGTVWCRAISGKESSRQAPMLSGQVAKASPEVKIQRRHGNTQPTGPQMPLSPGAKRCTSSFMSVANGRTGNPQAATMNLKTSSRQSAQPEFITLAAWLGHWHASPWLALLLLPLGHNCGTNQVLVALCRENF